MLTRLFSDRTGVFCTLPSRSSTPVPPVPLPPVPVPPLAVPPLAELPPVPVPPVAVPPFAELPPAELPLLPPALLPAVEFCATPSFALEQPGPPAANDIAETESTTLSSGLSMITSYHGFPARTPRSDTRGRSGAKLQAYGFFPIE